MCDVDRGHLAAGPGDPPPGVTGYTDFREVLERPDIDVVHVATPPHWHALISVAAAEAGKDIWCEKPMTRTIGEGRAVVGAVERCGRVLRVNTWFRFQDRFYDFGAEVKPLKKAVEGGLLGWPIKATVGAATGFDWKSYWTGLTNLPPQPVPPELDYDFWLGPAPVKPYHPHRVHGTFRGYWDYDGGGLGDMGMHYLDPVQYVLGKDDTSPVEVWADGPQQHPDACGTWRRIEMRYADGCTIVLDGEDRDKQAPFLEGPQGRSSGASSRHPAPAGEDRLPAGPRAPGRRLRRVRADAAPLRPEREERPPVLHARQPGQVAVQLGRPLRFDPEKQRFVDDEEANRLVDQPMRAPWRLPAEAPMKTRPTTFEARPRPLPSGSALALSAPPLPATAQPVRGPRLVRPRALPGGEAGRARRPLRRASRPRARPPWRRSAPACSLRGRATTRGPASR